MSASYRVVAPPLAAITLSAAVFFSPAASAQPDCGSVSPQPTAPRTSHCTTSGGSVAIVTSPPAMGSPTWPGFTYNYWDRPNYIVGFP